MFSSPGRSTIGVKRGSDVRKTNEAIGTSMHEDPVNSNYLVNE